MPTGSRKKKGTIFGLNASVYTKICAELNKPVEGRDYKALAGRMRYTVSELKEFQLEKSPADALLSKWGTKLENDVYKLIVILKEMERGDLVDMLEEQSKIFKVEPLNMVQIVEN